MNLTLDYELRLHFKAAGDPWKCRWQPENEPACWDAAKVLVTNAPTLGDSGTYGTFPNRHYKLFNATGAGPRLKRHEVNLPAPAIHTLAMQAAGYCSAITTEFDYETAVAFLGQYRRNMACIVAIINRTCLGYENGNPITQREVYDICNRTSAQTRRPTP